VTRVLVATGLAVCLLVSAPSAPAANKKLNQAAVALLQKAIAASDIESKGSTAFQLHATVTLAGANSKHPDGTLVEFWTPAGQRRAVTTLQGFQLVRVSDGRHIWTKSTVNFVPFDVYAFWAALAFAKELREWTDISERPLFVAGMVQTYLLPSRAREELDKPRLERKENEYCVEATGGWLKKQFCFDRSTGNLLHLTEEGLVSYEYSDYGAFGQKMFPRTIRAFSGKKKTEIFEIHIDRIDALTKLAPETFLPDKGSQEGPDEAQCAEIKPPKVVSMTPPVYPLKAKLSYIEGRVTMYGYIGVDGVPRGLLPLSPPSPLLTNAALDAVSQWRYRPLVCGNGPAAEPAAAMTYITIIFTLGG
jgi:hypothetical protein